MQSLIQFVGRRLPGFLREAVIGILGLDCYITLLYNGDILDRYCLSLGISKALGAGIVIFGSILKIPQIFKIVRNRSAAGVSLGMYALEVLAYDISLAYAVRRRIPFSTYGENASLTVQNMLITLLIMHYKPASTLSTRSTSHARSLLLAALSMLLLSYALFTPAIISDANLAILQLFSIPISLLSKVPQIRELHFRKRTGQLSALVVFAQLAGTIARVFTTLTETSDKLLLWGFSLASLFNAFIAAQYIYYWNGNSSTIYTPHMSARERELRRIANARNAVGLHPLYKKVDDEDHRANSLSNSGAAGGWAQGSASTNGSEGAGTQEGKGWEGRGRPEPLDLQGNSSSATYGNSLERRLPSAAANGLGAGFEEIQTYGSPSAKGLGRSNTIGSRAHSPKSAGNSSAFSPTSKRYAPHAGSPLRGRRSAEEDDGPANDARTGFRNASGGTIHTNGRPHMSRPDSLRRAISYQHAFPQSQSQSQSQGYAVGASNATSTYDPTSNDEWQRHRTVSNDLRASPGPGGGRSRSRPSTPTNAHANPGNFGRVPTSPALASFRSLPHSGSRSASTERGRVSMDGSRPAWSSSAGGANAAGYNEGEQMEYLLPSSPSLRGMGAIDVDSAYAHEEEDRGGDTFSIRLPSEVDTGGLLSPRSSSGNLRRLKASRSWNSLAAQAAPVVVGQAAEKTEDMKMGLGLGLGQAGLPRARGSENVRP
ncbi:hypothetical protein IE81DRAFT_61364 [Ceraceosorus guamensis]|uniref:Mannose-P-dolichol utilization defect 1 protein homolog n=1 Tax=Ceraceosorus guamensis TaxID=1522189 RepID=A0A316W2D7_9BASI|nr:hypothetical protein IE81DRAFT_61364 [Ceraceosorus guamensis]PWN43849.1 hypothetical protein IE81DRAFT_61364 [Ceraceosorus guamensis]